MLTFSKSLIYERTIFLHCWRWLSKKGKNLEDKKKKEEGLDRGSKTCGTFRIYKRFRDMEFKWKETIID